MKLLNNVKSQIQNLINIINEATGELDTNLTTAIDTLIYKYMYSFIATENVNHILSAKLTASTVEQNMATLGAANAGDGDYSTRWSSETSSETHLPEEQWIKATFLRPVLIKHIMIYFHSRNIEPVPANVYSLSIKYTDKDGVEKYVKKDY